MRLISTAKMIAFYTKHSDAEQPLKAWLAEVKNANWKTPQEIKAQYRNASFLSNNRIVFNIKGNDYRIVVAVAYKLGAMYIKFIGTHSEYDKINAETVEIE